MRLFENGPAGVHGTIGAKLACAFGIVPGRRGSVVITANSVSSFR